jgi:hypothetical protein
VLGTPAAQGRLSQVQGEVLGTPATQGRLSQILGEVLWPFLRPVASVPDITGLVSLPATFDASASTNGFGDNSTLSYLWSWTSVPGGSAIANISPTPMPDAGGSGFISMANNRVLYHCEGNGTDSSPGVAPTAAPMPDNGATSFISMANNAVLYHCETGTPYSPAIPFPDSGAVTPFDMTNNSVLFHCENDNLDTSGNSNNATLSSVTTNAVGQVGTYAWQFDTSASRATLASSVSCAGAYTIAFWFFGLGADGTWRAAISNASTQYAIVVSPSNLLTLYIGGSATSSITMQSASYTGWHHLAAVASGSSTDFYIDGYLVGTVAAKITTNITTIGNSAGFSERFASRMDEVAIWTRALSAAEIENIAYYQGAPPSRDSSGNSNSVTFSNVTEGAAGKVGVNAWSFNTASAYVTLNSAVSLAGDHTFACWFYNLGPDNLYRSLVMDNPSTRLFLVEQNTGLLGVWTGASLLSCGFHMPASGYTGWHHIAVVCGGATTDFYVDGVFVGTSAGRMSTNLKYLGGSFSPNQRFAERLDEVAAWTRALSAAEIEALWLNQVGTIIGNTATFSNVTAAAVGKVGANALSFNTTAAYAAITTPVPLGPSWTYSFWFYNLKQDNTFRAAIRNSNNTRCACIVWQTNSELSVWNGSIQVSSGFVMREADYTGWHHMVAVGNAGVTAFYVDGKYVGTAAYQDTTGQRFIGNTGVGVERFADRMDEIAIWRRALSASEVETLWLNQVGGYAGVGSTFTFTPDVTGTYTVQLGVRDSLRSESFPVVNDSANAEITRVSGLGVWPQEMLRMNPLIQGSRLKARPGQL